MADLSLRPSKGRSCFVTVGATSAFAGLLRAVLEKPFLESLALHGYSDLRIQYGKDGESIVRESLAIPAIETEQLGNFHGISITGFDFRADGLAREMSRAQGQKGREGVVISHAGTGSILDAMRINVPLIVVPNASLLHNHQEELAEELADQGYVIHGRLDNLMAALGKVEALGKDQKPWPPRQQEFDPSGKGLIGVLDDEMGFVD